MLTLKRRWKTALKVAVSGGLLVYLVHLVDARAIAGALAQADARFLVGGFGLYLAGQALSGVRWRMLSTAVGFGAPGARFVAWYFVGMFFNSFGLGTVSGDLARAMLLGRGHRRTLALSTVIADRLGGLLVLLAITLVSLLLFRSYQLPWGLYWSSLLLAAGLLLGWYFAPSLASWLLPRGSWLRGMIEVDLAPYWDDYALVVRTSALSALFHVSQIGVLVLLANSLGLDVPWSYFFVFGPLVNIFSSLPIGVNGIGIREASYMFFLTHIGIPADAAMAFALLWLGLVILGGAAGGFLYLGLDDGVRESESETEAVSAERIAPPPDRV